ncbi:MAG: putative zinc-binding metallopeptidase, partial [Planctomycetota bacterium]
GLPLMVDRYIKLDVVLNEMNRSMGLIDLVPEIFAPPIVVKLSFVHDLVGRARRPPEREPNRTAA